MMAIWGGSDVRTLICMVLTDMTGIPDMLRTPESWNIVCVDILYRVMF